MHGSGISCLQLIAAPARMPARGQLVSGKGNQKQIQRSRKMRSRQTIHLPRRAAASFNKPDAANPAIALWLTMEDQWRRVTDLGR
jgi:hypothetical protein